MVLDTTKRIPHDAVKMCLLDCGAYSEKQLTPQQILEAYEKLSDTGWPIHHVAIIDIIGDPEATVESAITCIDEVNLNWIPVLQGHSVNSYKWCAQMYEDEDITADIWALGGLKVLSPLLRRSVINLFKDRRIHAFGLTISDLKDPVIWNNIYSTDTSTWQFGPNGRPRTTTEKYQNFEDFKYRLKRLFQSYEGMTLLEEFTQ